MSKTILIVEDQFIEANNLKLILQKAGNQVLPIARTVPAALKILETESPDVVLLDIVLQTEQTGIELARILRSRSIAFIYLSANADPVTFKQAKETGPYGFLVKPFRMEDVLAMLEIADYLHQQHLALLKLEADSPSSPAFSLDNSVDSIIGKSEKITKVTRLVKIAATTDFPALILGESGTGKELVAKAIHRNSRQKDKNLVIVDCAALPVNLVESELFGHEKGSFTGAHEKRTGKFDQADEGTIFLDEIGELSLEMQVKFLRVLQEKEICPVGGKRKKINVRVLAATNRNLEDEVAAGRFRLDLYYRLNVFPIHMPPLRERNDDILLLAEHFLRYFSKREHKSVKGFRQDVKNAILGYYWPGNVRELENLVARAVLLSEGDQITAFPLPSTRNVNTESTYKIKSITENERDHILAVLAHCNGKIYGPGGAAELLEINGSTLKSRMKKLGIEKKFFSNDPSD